MNDSATYSGQTTGSAVKVMIQTQKAAAYTTLESGAVKAEIIRPQQVTVTQYITGPAGPSGAELADMPDLALLFENKLI